MLALLALLLALSALLLAADVAAASSSPEHALWHVNTVRVGHGLPALPTDHRLCATAAWRSADMAERHYFGHEIPGHPGRVFAELSRRGIRYHVAGEILAWTTASDAIAWATAAWMASWPHRAVILGWWRGACVGIAVAGESTYLTVLFVR